MSVTRPNFSLEQYEIGLSGAIPNREDWSEPAMDRGILEFVSLFSGIVYIAATIGLVTNRPWSRPLAWAAVGTEMVGVVTIGLASIIDSTAFPHDTVWSRFGAGYGYVPVILPVLGLMWLWQSRDQHGNDTR